MFRFDTSRFRRSLKASTSGSVAPIYALSAVAIITLAGFGMDFRRIENTKSRSQDAVDSAVLAATREYVYGDYADDTAREAGAEKVAKDYFVANLEANEVELQDIQFHIEFIGSNQIRGIARGELNLFFGGFIGHEKTPIEATSVAKAGNAERLEIVLALDNSTSMFEQGRMSTMRAAAVSFVNTLFDESEYEGSVQIGVVPWAATVNIDAETPQNWNTAAGSSNSVGDDGTRVAPPAVEAPRYNYVRAPWATSGSYDKVQADKDFAPVGWRGCITAAPNERQVNSLGNVTAELTDAPPSGLRWPALRVEPEMNSQYVRIGDPPPNPNPPSPSPGPSGPRPSPTPQPPPVGSQAGLDLGPSAPLASAAMTPTPFESAGYAAAAAKQPQSSNPWTMSLDHVRQAYAQTPVQPYGGTATGCQWYSSWQIKNDPLCFFDTYQQPKKSQCEVAPTDTYNNYHACSVPSCDINTYQWGEPGLRNGYRPYDISCSENWRKIQTDNSAACVSDPNEFAWFDANKPACPWQNKASILPYDGPKAMSGPNLTCPSSMMGMSQDRAQIIDKLNHMYPVPGGTLADVGLMWGLRMLSDNTAWKSFFNYNATTQPLPFKDKGARKIVVLLSDGNNEAPYHFEGYYGCTEKWQSGWSQSGRGTVGNCKQSPGIGVNDKDLMDKALDNLMIDACNAIKKQEIELHTIAVDLDESIPEEKEAIELLGECASDASRAHVITSSELNVTFQGIASSALRLTE